MGQPVAGVRANEPAKPRHSAHRAVLQLRHSQEWATWTSRNEKLMSHTDFANFLEENAIDVVSPDGAALLELTRDLQVKGGVTFKSSVRMGDTVSFEYQKADDVSTKGDLELPAMISIAIPVYFGEEPITMNVLLRRKIDDGQLFLGFKIMRMENVKQSEFLRIATRSRTTPASKACSAIRPDTTTHRGPPTGGLLLSATKGIEMDQPIGRASTKEETELARQMALVLADVVLTVDTATGFGAVGMLLEAMFLKGIKPEYILRGFDEFTQHTRKSIEKGLRRAHN
jgi:hypothetical protein